MSRQFAAASRQRRGPARAPEIRFEEVTWDRYTLRLPERLPQGTNLTASVVNRFFTLTVNAFDASQAPALTKLNAFVSRFNHDAIGIELNGNFSALFNANQGLDSPIRFAHPGVFAFSDIQLTNRTGGALQLQAGVGGAPAPALAPGTRNAARFVQFTVSADPRAAYTGEPADRDAAGMRPQSWTLGVQLPTETNNQGGTALHHLITADIILNIPLLLQNIETIQGHVPNIGKVYRPTGGVSVQLQETEFRNEFMEFYNNNKFQIAKVLMKKLFVSDFAQEGNTIQQELMGIHQVKFENGQNRWRSIREYHEEFSGACQLQPPGVNFGFDIVQIFYGNTSAPIRNAALADRYVFPIGPPGETNQGQLQRLRQVKDAMESYEHQNRHIQQQSGRYSGNVRGSGGAAAFMSVPTGGFGADFNAYHIGGGDNDWGGGAMPNQEGAEDLDSPFVGIGDPAAFLVDPTISLLAMTPDAIFDRAAEQVAVHMSVCEDAMRRATGSANPPPECWGCTTHPQFHDQRFHLYRDCPHKSDPLVLQNKAAALKDFLEKRGRKPAAAASMATVSAVEEGYPSDQAKVLITSIADPTTRPEQRKKQKLEASPAFLIKPRADSDYGRSHSFLANRHKRVNSLCTPTLEKQCVDVGPFKSSRNGSWVDPSHGYVTAVA